jgi:hypothetical protein
METKKPSDICMCSGGARGVIPVCSGVERNIAVSVRGRCRMGEMQEKPQDVRVTRDKRYIKDKKTRGYSRDAWANIQ